MTQSASTRRLPRKASACKCEAAAWPWEEAAGEVSQPRVRGGGARAPQSQVQVGFKSSKENSNTGRRLINQYDKKRNSDDWLIGPGRPLLPRLVHLYLAPCVPQRAT